MLISAPAVYTQLRGELSPTAGMAWWVTQYTIHLISVTVAYLPWTNKRLDRFGLPRGFLVAAGLSAAALGSLLFF